MINYSTPTLNLRPQDCFIIDFISATNRTFTIPVYQRNYSWDPENCDQLFDDLEEILRTGENHYFGNVVFYELSRDSLGYSNFALIDGQQRITSVMLLIAAIRDSESDPVKRDRLTRTYLKNHDGEEVERVKLKQVEGDRNVYEAIVNGTFDGSSRSTVGRNYKRFLELIKTRKFSTDELLYALGRLEIIALDLNLSQKPETAQVIFESINAKGKKLNQADLLRNYLLLGISGATTEERYAQQEAYYKNYWLPVEENIGTSEEITNFLNAYLAMRIGDNVKKDTEYSEFKKRFADFFNSDAAKALEELKHYSQYYLWIKHPALIAEKHKKLSAALSDIQELSMSMSTPLLLYLAEKSDNETSQFTYDAFERALRYLESWTFRVRVTGYLSTGLFNSIVSRSLLNHIRTSAREDYDQVLIYELSNYRTQDIWPTDDEFQKAFTKYNFYKNYKNYVQRKLEWKKSNDRDNKKPDSIEHILPETLSKHWKNVLGADYTTLHAEWLHTIGNLTPMNQPDNSFNSNDPYETKRPQYEVSSWLLTREVASIYAPGADWNIREIQARAKDLSDTALEVWHGPLVRERDIVATTKLEDNRIITPEMRDKLYHLECVRDNKYTISATMRISYENGKNLFTVLAGSRIYPYKRAGKQVINSKLLDLQGFNYAEVLDKDYVFESPSGASKLVVNGFRNGWDMWLDEEGTSLNELAMGAENGE